MMAFAVLLFLSCLAAVMGLLGNLPMLSRASQAGLSTTRMQAGPVAGSGTSSSSPRIREIIMIAENRKANGEYEWEEKYEAGIQLCGTEVKSCRKNQAQLSDGIAEIRGGEAWLLNVHINEYERCGMREQHPPKRARKLLLHGREILKLEQRVLQRNMEIIPIRLFFNEKACVKVELGVGKKKSLGDKRDDMVKRDGEREMRRVMKGGYD